MFEMARDHARLSTNFEVVGGYLSPVNDSYRKSGLVAAHHRIAMCELACRRSSDWIMLDRWEAVQDDYTPTAPVLDHFNAEINEKRGGVDVVVGEGEERRTEKRRVKIVLLAGSDLIQTMSEPGVWAEQDVRALSLSLCEAYAFLLIMWIDPSSCTTSLASTAATSSNERLRMWTRPSSRTRPSTRATCSPCTGTTSLRSTNPSGTTCHRQRSGSS
jgi:hypothetical protein